MQSQDKFTLLRRILHALGLSTEAIDDIVDRILDFLSDKGEKQSPQLVYPYSLRDNFLSPAEHNFYLVLKSAVSESALICPKVALGDLFYVRSSDPSEFRIYTNKIDRKHVDFLLCDPKTVKPLLGIELDDKSHRRSDRQERDEFIGEVFAAAKLPLVRMPVQTSYSAAQLKSILQQHLSASSQSESASISQSYIEEPKTSTKCPKCGSVMVLRTAKSGVNQGGQFWGCPNFPKCRGFLKYAPRAQE